MASARSLGVLTLDLILKLGGFTKGADQAARESDKLSRKLKKDAAEIGGVFKKIGATLGIGLGLQQVASGIINAATAAVKFGDDINRAAIKTGESAETISELAYAAKIADVEFGGLSLGITKMQRAISEASTGNKSAIESFALLGLRVSDLKGLDAADQLELVADAIAHIPDDADRARAAIEIFGKAGADLLPLFEKGAAGIREAREEAHKLGVTLTDEQAQALADTDDAIVRLTESYSGLAQQLTALAAPSFISFFDGVAASIKVANDDSLSLLDKLGMLGKAIERANENDKGLFDPITAKDLAQAYKEVADEMERAGRSAALGSKARTGAMSRGPGYAGEVAAATVVDAGGAGKAAKEAARAAKAAADQAAKEADERARIEARALEELAAQYEDTYRRGAEAIAATRTASERELDVLHEHMAALDALAATFPNLAEAAQEAKAKLETEFLADIVITVDRIEVPEPVRTEFEDFTDDLGRNMENMIADFFVNPFERGFNEILSGFAAMVASMIAQSLAADLVKKMMGSSSGGSGGGWLEMFAGFFESGGFVPPGQMGIVGEAGPEIVMGGRTGQTVVPMQAGAAPQVNLRNINAFDTGVIRDYLVSAGGEEVLLNFIERNGTRVRMAQAGG